MNIFDCVPVYVKVVEVGSFSGAARLLNMPKTTVSAKVAALEKQVGVKLIHRTTRKLHVTEAGSKYFHHCANAMQEMELAEGALQAIQTEPTGLLRVTAPVDVSHVLLPRITAAYLARFPTMSVELLVTNRFVDLLDEGIDLAIRAGDLKNSLLIARQFLEVRGSLWASPGYLRRIGNITHPKNLAKASFVRMKGFDKLRLGNGRAEVEIDMKGRVIVDDFEAIKALASLGEGVAWLPDFLAVDAVDAGALVPVIPNWTSKGMRHMHFVYPGRQYKLPKVQAFIQVAQEIAASRTAR